MFMVRQFKKGKTVLFFSYLFLSMILIGPSMLTDSVSYLPSFLIFTSLKLSRFSPFAVFS